MKQNICILILRVLLHHFEFIKPFAKYAKKYIPHQFSASFKKKIECFNLGLVFENENTTEVMVHIWSPYISMTRTSMKEWYLVETSSLTNVQQEFSG